MKLHHTIITTLILTWGLTITIHQASADQRKFTFDGWAMEIAEKSKKHNKPTKRKVYPLGDEMILPVINIYDGDTIETRLTLPPPINVIKVRIRGIDTPEMPAASYKVTGKLGRAKCVQEAELALKATAWLNAVQNAVGGAMTVTDFKYGAYAGRIVGNVSIGGEDVATMMLDNGFAVPLADKQKRYKDWCK